MLIDNDNRLTELQMLSVVIDLLDMKRAGTWKVFALYNDDWKLRVQVDMWSDIVWLPWYQALSMTLSDQRIGVKSETTLAAKEKEGKIA